MTSTGGVFIVIVFGIVLACITLAIEYCWYKVHGPNPEEMETNTQSDKVLILHIINILLLLSLQF